MGFLKKIGSAIGNFVGSATGIGSLIQAGTGILGNIMGSKSQQSANDANLRINQMNNEFNERMLEKQMRYNSASAQVDRFKEAGLNPALMMQGQGAGTATSASSSGAAPMQGYGYDFSDIGNAISNSIQRYKENELLDKQIEHLNIENQYLTQQKIQELANMKEQGMSIRSKRKIDDITAQNLNNLQTSEYYLNLAKKDDIQSQIEKRTAEALLLSKELSIFDERLQLDLAQRAANILLTNANVHKSKQETIHEIQKMIETVARTKGIKISNNVARRTADSLVKRAYYDSVPTGSWSNLVGSIGHTIGWLGKGKDLTK